MGHTHSHPHRTTAIGILIDMSSTYVTSLYRAGASNRFNSIDNRDFFVSMRYGAFGLLLVLTWFALHLF